MDLKGVITKTLTESEANDPRYSEVDKVLTQYHHHMIASHAAEMLGDTSAAEEHMRQANLAHSHAKNLHGEAYWNNDPGYQTYDFTDRKKQTKHAVLTKMHYSLG